jgi:pimeloyl-ACP methyl ester carboxylesterase
MPYLNVGADLSGQPIDLFYQDIGSGKPIVLIHGWPLDHSSWAYQIAALVEQGYRVVAYDRRGFGKSSQPSYGYDYDTLADDLKAVLDTLALLDVTLVGFSMGGGEVARYMRRHAGSRVARVAFVSAVTPFLLKRDDNPDGVDRSVFDGMVEGLEKDRPDFLAGFGKTFYGVGLLSHPVSDATLQWSSSIALPASHIATVACVRAFSETDFRQDLKAISVPTLIIHGDKDETVPLKVSAARTAEALPHATYTVYEGAPHGLNITEKDRLSADLAAFAAGA